MDENKDLKPFYIKGGRDLKGVDKLEQYFGTKDYLVSIGITPKYYIREKNLISEVSENEFYKRLKKVEDEKEK